MSFVASPADATGRPQTRDSRETSCGNPCLKDPQVTVSPDNRCGDSCCRRRASLIEESIGERVQQLLAGRDAAEETSLIPGSLLACLPLTASSYRLLKHQFRIVRDYLSANNVSHIANRWGAIFHLRLIGARIRAARSLSANTAGNCEETRAFDSGCCGR